MLCVLNERVNRAKIGSVHCRTLFRQVDIAGHFSDIPRVDE